MVHSRHILESKSAVLANGVGMGYIIMKEKIKNDC